MAAPVRLAVAGAGLIGRRHIAHVMGEACSELVAIVDPMPAAQALAAEAGVAWYPRLEAMLREVCPQGVVMATPTQMHVENALDCVSHGVPVLVEKPIADDVVAATRLVEAAERAGVALLVGHHRRHNPLIQEARRAIEAGRIGKIVAVQGTCWFYKPAGYFAPQWRREKGAGPVLTNLIHDVDLLRYLCGEVVAVQAMQSNAQRRHAVEETAVILLRFASGVLGTLSVSDTVVAPWSWEFTSGENPAYTRTPESCYMIGGTEGSLTVPYLDLWRHTTRPDWWEPLARTRIAVEQADPLALQIRNFCGVIRGRELPVVPGDEGLRTLRVIAAVQRAAESGRLVAVG